MKCNDIPKAFLPLIYIRSVFDQVHCEIAYNDNDNDFISSQNSTVCSVDLTIKILQK